MKNILGLILIAISTLSMAQITIQAETATLVGTQVESWEQGYTGTGYVTGLDNEGDKLTINFTVPTTASYKLEITYSAGSYKEQNLLVNNISQGKLLMPVTNGFETSTVGGVFLEAGAASITIESVWGYVLIDKFTLTEKPPHNYNITTSLINPNTDAKTVAVWDYLKANYGKKIISGQIDNWDNLVAVAGKEPKIAAIDFQPYTQGYNYNWRNGAHAIGWKDAGRTEELIDWYNSTEGCGIATIQWHWSSPSGSTPGVNSFYTNQTTFSVTNAVDPTKPEYDLIIEDIDSIATQLKKLETAGVPVLWRPLHEAGGAWFWWGAEGSEAALELWDIVYDRLTNHHNLNNLIWVWSTPEEDWYPGNDKLDVFGFDSYPGAYNYATQKAIFDQYYELCAGEKIIAMTENGPIPDIDALKTQDAMWSYFSSWNEHVINENTTVHIQSSYANSLVITQDDPCGVISGDELVNKELSLYPNPTTGPVKLKGNSLYVVYSITGKEQLRGNSDMVDLTALPDGVYLIQQEGLIDKVIKE